MKRIIKILILLIVFSLPAMNFAQPEQQFNRSGSEYYKKGEYQKAEENFYKAHRLDTSNLVYNYNLSDALYKQEKYDSAASVLSAITNQTMNKDTLSKINYNLGNSLFKKGEILEKKFDGSSNNEQSKNEYLKESIDNIQKSIDAYKTTLKNNPHSEDARYNLAYANRKLEELLKKLPQNKDKSDNSNSKNNSKDPDKNKENKNHQNDKQKKNNNSEEKNQQQKPSNSDNQKQKQPQMSKQEVEQILQTLSQEEKKVIKQRLKKAKSKSIKTSKPW